MLIVTGCMGFELLPLQIPPYILIRIQFRGITRKVIELAQGVTRGCVRLL